MIFTQSRLFKPCKLVQKYSTLVMIKSMIVVVYFLFIFISFLIVVVGMTQINTLCTLHSFTR